METVTQSAPPLDGDLGSVNTERPLLQDGYYDLRIAKAELKPTKAGGQMISLEYETLAPAKTMDQRDVGPGIKVFDNLNIAPTGKATWQMVIENVAVVAKAVGFVKEKGWNWAQYGANTEAQVKNAQAWIPQLLGRTFRAKVGNEPAGTDKNGKAFRAKNKIVTYVPAT